MYVFLYIIFVIEWKQILTTDFSVTHWLRKRREDPVQQWLMDIRWSTEMECMNVLQGKSIVQSVEKSAFHTSHIKGRFHTSTIKSRFHAMHIKGSFFGFYKFAAFVIYTSAQE